MHEILSRFFTKGTRECAVLCSLLGVLTAVLLICVGILEDFACGCVRGCRRVLSEASGIKKVCCGAGASSCLAGSVIKNARLLQGAEMWAFSTSAGGR